MKLNITPCEKCEGSGKVKTSEKNIWKDCPICNATGLKNEDFFLKRIKK
jgi:DnaJ-class molecular chaperone